MTTFNRVDSYSKAIDRIGLFFIGVFCVLYSLFWSGFAEMHIQLPFLNFPIFIGEMLLAVCVILLIVRWKIAAIRFNRWYGLLLIYIAWFLVKAFCGYYVLGPLAFRTAALFYYPLFAVIGYHFYRARYFNQKTILFLLFTFAVVKIAAPRITGRDTFNVYFFFPYFALFLVLILNIRKRWAKYGMCIALLFLFPYKMFFYGSRSSIAGNAAAWLFLSFMLFFSGMLKMKIWLRVSIVLLLLVVAISGFLIFAQEHQIKSLTTPLRVIEEFQRKDAVIQKHKKDFERLDLTLTTKLYNPNEAKPVDSRLAGLGIEGEMSGKQQYKGQELSRENIAYATEDSLDYIMEKTISKIEKAAGIKMVDTQLTKATDVVSPSEETISQVKEVTEREAVYQQLAKATDVVQAQQEATDIALMRQRNAELAERLLTDFAVKTESILKHHKEQMVTIIDAIDISTEDINFIAFLRSNVDKIARENKKLLQQENEKIMQQAVDARTLYGTLHEEGFIALKKNVEVITQDSMNNLEEQRLKAFNRVRQVELLQKSAEIAERLLSGFLVEIGKVLKQQRGQMLETMHAIVASTEDIDLIALINSTTYKINQENQKLLQQEKEKVIQQAVEARTLHGTLYEKDFIKLKKEINDIAQHGINNLEKQRLMTYDRARQIELLLRTPVVRAKIEYGNIMFRLFIWRDMLSELVQYWNDDWKKALLGFSFGKPQRSISLEILGQATGEWSRDGWITPHNSFLHIIYRAGILGVLMVIAIFAFLFFLAKEFVKQRSVTGLLLMSILVYWSVVANFLVVLELPYQAIPFWSLWGMTCAYYAHRKKNTTETA